PHLTAWIRDVNPSQREFYNNAVHGTLLVASLDGRRMKGNHKKYLTRARAPSFEQPTSNCDAPAE
ncbi:hypothetical protein, partial [Sinirhodobacter huangdaonensis]|uniref:hypothetical protein n=1 Tax=Paenirhodobacter huangdaonensis TaxID=2501515 RepID=UPI00360D6613